MLDAQYIARTLGGEVTVNGIAAPGPGHSVRDRSLSIKLDADAPDGFVVHSFAGDDPIACKEYVRQKLGLDGFRPRKRKVAGRGEIEEFVAAALKEQRAPTGQPIATFDYTDAGGTLLYQILRFANPKTFRQRQPDGNGGWTWKVDRRRVLYRLAELLKFSDAIVFVCEGEKDADRLAALNYCATTVASGKWTDECIEPLKGRDIVVLQDNDKAGEKRAIEAAQQLHGVANSLRVVLLPELPPGGDVSDWLDADEKRIERFEEICLRETPLWTPDESSQDHGGWKYHSGEPPSPPRWLIKGILPETGMALVAGQWGTFKTTVALDISICVMANLPFADRYSVKRHGAVLYFALEGEGMLQTRLAAIAAQRGITGTLAFAWRGDCPSLTDKNAADLLCRFATEAAPT